MEPTAKTEKEFFNELLTLCKKFGFSISCSDPYEFICIGAYTEDFEEYYKELYLE